MKFAKFCKSFSIILFFVVISWLIWFSNLLSYFNIAILIVLSAAVVCIFIYGLGEIVESLRCMDIRMINKEIKEETENKINIKD